MLKRRMALLLIMAVMLVSLPMNSFAAENDIQESEESDVTVDPGITPDSWLYGLDSFMNNLNLLITFDTADKAELLSDISEERLAEAKQMVDENKDEYGVIAMKAYKDALERSVDIIDDAIVNEKDIDDVIDEFNTTFVNHQELVQFIVEQFPEDVKAEINDSLMDTFESIVITIDMENGGLNYDIVVKEANQDSEDEEIENEEVAVSDDEDTNDEDINSEEINDEDTTDEQTTISLPLRKIITAENLAEEIDEDAAELYISGELNARQILSIHSFAKQTGKSFDEVLEVFMANEKGIGATAKALGLAPKNALKEIKGTFKDVKKQIKEDFGKAKKETKIDIEEDNVEEAVEQEIQNIEQQDVNAVDNSDEEEISADEDAAIQDVDVDDEDEDEDQDEDKDKYEDQDKGSKKNNKNQDKNFKNKIANSKNSNGKSNKK